MSLFLSGRLFSFFTSPYQSGCRRSRLCLFVCLFVCFFLSPLSFSNKCLNSSLLTRVFYLLFFFIHLLDLSVLSAKTLVLSPDLNLLSFICVEPLNFRADCLFLVIDCLLFLFSTTVFCLCPCGRSLKRSYFLGCLLLWSSLLF